MAITQRFPTSVGSNGSRYIFFSSLLKPSGTRSHTAQMLANKTGFMGINYLTQNAEHGKANIDVVENKMQQVLPALKAVADAEFAKEQAYINYQKKKTNSSIFNLPIPSSPEEEWSNFITLLNFARGNGDTFFNDVKKELARVEANIQYMKDIEEKIAREKPSAKTAKLWRQGYERTEQYRSTEYLVPLVKQLFGTAKSGRNSYANVIKDYIIKTNWQKFMYVDGKRIQFDSASFNTLVFASLQLIIQEMVKNANLKLDEIFNGEKSYDGMMTAFSKWMENTENQKLIGMEKLNGILDSPFAKKMIVQSFKNKLQISEKEASEEEKQKRKGAAKTQHSKKLAKQIQDEGRSEKEMQQIRKDLASLISGGQWLQVHSSLYQPSGNWLITEAAELIPIRNGQFNVSLGSSSVKVDNLFIEANIEVNESLFYDFDKRTQEAFKDTFDPLKDGNKALNGDVSTSNWRVRQSKLKKYKEELSAILLEQQNLKDLTESFIIETSDKIYESYGAKTLSFSGGSMGQNLMSQLTKIDELAASGGMNIGDLNWLRSAVINSHKSTVLGTGMKKTLENYLSMIAVALLFDDGVEIMEQATKSISQAISSTTVNTIHLFFLQGFGYYPLSQVLYYIYNDLSKTVDEAITFARGGGAKVTISLKNYPKDLSPYSDMTIQTWEQTGATAEAGALLNMTFLGKFMDILQGLTQPGI